MMAFPGRLFIALMLVIFVSGISCSTYKRLYPDTTIERAVVNKTSKPWAVKVDYNPPEYSKPCISIDKCDVSAWACCFAFNKYGHSVDRRSATFGRYKVNSKCEPLNPRGRTGIRGRGSLLRYGPNHIVVVIISRNGNPLQYVSKISHGQHAFEEFPWQFTDNPKMTKLPVKLENVIREDLRKHYPESTVDEIIEKAKKKRRLVYHGYYHDERNTDNAWIESLIYEIRDPDSKGLGLMTLQGDNAMNLTWKTADLEGLETKIETIINQARLTKREKLAHQLSELLQNTRPTDASILLDMVGNVVNLVGIGASFNG
uniref:Nudix hydrolase domain-containing protein n=1 Tax=Trichuris muris TaxID=70415 RepID=A0A5S6QXD8_TRIMR